MAFVNYGYAPDLGSVTDEELLEDYAERGYPLDDEESRLFDPAFPYAKEVEELRETQERIDARYFRPVGHAS